MSDWQPIETAPKDGTEILGRAGLKRIRLVWWFEASRHTRGWLDENGANFQPDEWAHLPGDHPMSTPEQARIAELEAALRDVREEICLGPVDDVLWHRESPSETTVDFICNTLGDDWSYDVWLAQLGKGDA